MQVRRCDVWVQVHLPINRWGGKKKKKHCSAGRWFFNQICYMAAEPVHWATCKRLVKNKKAYRAGRSRLFLLTALTHSSSCPQRAETKQALRLNQWLWRPKHIFSLLFALRFLMCNLTVPNVCVCVQVDVCICVYQSPQILWCMSDFPQHDISYWDVNQNYNFNNHGTVSNEIRFTSNELWTLQCRRKSIGSLTC